MAQPRSRFPAYPPDLPEGLQLYLEAIRKEISTLGVSGGASIRIEESDAVVSTGANVIDFFGTDFDVTQSPVGEANIAISSAIARTGHTHDAADVTSGIFSRARLPSQLAYEDEANTFTLTQTFSVQLVSSVTTGTAPFSVASTTVVTNLNADFLDGQTGTFYTDLANATGNLAYARLPTGGGTWANGGTLSITGGVTTVAGLTSTANVSITAGKLLVDGTDQTLASGEIGLAENVGELWIGARSVIRLLMDDDATAAGSVVIAKGTQASSTTLLTVDINGSVVFATAAGKIIPGATSLSLRNTGDSADNILITDAGAITFRSSLAGATTLSLAGPITLTTAASKIIPGATSLALRNTADSADNAIWINAGDATFRTKLTMPGPLVLTTAASTIVPGATSLALRNTADSANNLLITDAGVSTFRNDVVMDVLGTYDHTGTRFTTGTGPAADDVMSYHSGAGKWRPRFLQTAFTSGAAVSQNNTDGTFATFYNSNPTLSGTPTAPTNAPVTTAMYKSILIDMSAYALGGTQAYVLDYSINAGAYTSGRIVSTSAKVIHSNLDPANTYAYKYKIRGGSDSTYSPAASAINPSSATEANAFGLIVASQIATAYLSSINANIGSITAGQLISGDGKSLLQLDSTFSIPGTVTQGIFFASANPVPGGITGMYLDFTATGANHLFHHSKIDLNADGTATFGGLLDISNAPFAAGLANAYVVLRDPDVAHGMTSVVPTDVTGGTFVWDTLAGGIIYGGFAESTTTALQLFATNVSASTTGAVMGFTAGKKSGTTYGAAAATDLVFQFVNPGSNLFSIFGDGSAALLGALTLNSSLIFTTAASKVIPGATSLSLRNNADSADNLLLADGGAATFRGAVSGVTTLSLAGALTWPTDNTYDVGASGATRPRDVFVARDVVVDGQLKGTAPITLRYSNVTSAGTGAATAETDLMTHTLPTLANGDKVDVFVEGLVTGTNNAKTVRVRVGGAVAATVTCAAGEIGDYFFYVQLVKDGGTLRYIVGETTNVSSATSQWFAANQAIDLSGAIVKTTGQTTNAADEVTTEAMTIMIYKA